MLGLDEQLEVFDRNADKVFDRMIAKAVKYKDDIIELGRDRMIEGFDLYEDEMWGWDSDRRFDEWAEEMADALVYEVSECH